MLAIYVKAEALRCARMKIVHDFLMTTQCTATDTLRWHPETAHEPAYIPTCDVKRTGARPNQAAAHVPYAGATKGKLPLQVRKFCMHTHHVPEARHRWPRLVSGRTSSQ